MTTMLATTVVMFNGPIADESGTKVRIAQWGSLALIDGRGDVELLSLIEALDEKIGGQLQRFWPRAASLDSQLESLPQVLPFQMQGSGVIRKMRKIK
jgi:hypothetical protein